MELSIPVKVLVISWFIFCFGLLPLVAQDQQEIDLSHLDTFSPDRHTAKEFYGALHKARSRVVKSKSQNGVLALNKYVDKTKLFEGARPELLRNVYMFHADTWRRAVGYTSETEEYLLKAHHAIPFDSLMTSSKLFYIENRLGVLYNIFGDHDRSLYYYQIVLDGLRFQQSPKVCRALSNMARLRITMNDAENGLLLAEEGTQEAQRVGNMRSEMVNRMHLIDAHLIQQDFDAAEYQLDTILSLYGQDSSISQHTGILEIQARLLNEKENYQKAGLLYQDVIRSCIDDANCRNDRYQAKRYFKLGDVALHAGDLPTCDRALNNGFEVLLGDSQPLIIEVDSLPNENTFVQLYNLLARYQLELFKQSRNETHLDSCRRALDRAFYVFDKIVGDIPHELAKYVTAYNNKSLANTSINLCYALQELGRPLRNDEIIHYLEKSSSQVFNELLAQQAAYSRLSPVEKARLDHINMRLANNRTNTSTSVIDVGSSLSLSEVRDSILQSRLIDLSFVTSPVIYFIIGDESIFSLNSFQRKLQIINVGDTEMILAQAREFIRLIAQEEPMHDIKSLGRNVFSKLFKHIDHIPERFSVIGEGLLSQLPFDALVDTTGEFLIHNYEIDYRMSQRCIDHKLNLDKVHVISPSYATSTEYVPLRFVDQEVDHIKSSFKTVNVSPNLGLEQLESSLQGSGVFHYTGHAKSEGFQGSLLAPNARHNIYGRTISAIGSSKSLCVLSACETGIGEIKRGEGTMSLARAFLTGGTSNVINSLWAVNEQSTAHLMKNLYDKLTHQYNPGQALRLAKLAYLEEAIGEAKHPYHWAGFICTSTAVTKSDKRATWFYGILGIIAIIAYIIYFKRKL